MVLDHASFMMSGSLEVGIHIILRFVVVGFASLAVKGGSVHS